MREPPDSSAAPRRGDSDDVGSAPDVAPFLLICPTQRDHRELGRLGFGPDRIHSHVYATDALERIAGAVGGSAETVADPLEEIEAILQKYKDQPLSGVISTDDYPGTTIAAVVAHARGLPAPQPAVNLLLQHKYHARKAQERITPEATPPFTLLDPLRAGLPALDYPVFIKPVKSFFSIGAQIVSGPVELLRAERDWQTKLAFFAPFQRLLERYTSLPMRGYLLIEQLLFGRQVTLEGYACGGEIEILGIVDSIFTPGTIAFERFEYPSSLPAFVQAKMADIARRLIAGVGFRNGLFNIEMFYDPTSEAVTIIEVNPRIASQFADLYEKVDGYNSYQILLDIASGRRPHVSKAGGRYGFAASCVLRTFKDAMVTRVPTADDILRVKECHDDARVEVVVTENRALSEEMQDGQSYRYAVINLGGRDLSDVKRSLDECRKLLNFQFTSV